MGGAHDGELDTRVGVTLKQCIYPDPAQTRVIVVKHLDTIMGGFREQGAFEVVLPTFLYYYQGS